jgi:AMP nucleosidase
MSEQKTHILSPEHAVDKLEALHISACKSLRDALTEYAKTGRAPTPEERLEFRYPELKVIWEPKRSAPFIMRAWAKFQTPGTYTTTVTQPGFFRPYLLDQLNPLVSEFGAQLHVSISNQEIPYPYVTEAGDEFINGEMSVSELARHFPVPDLSAIGDEIADGEWEHRGGSMPLSLFDAARTDFSLKRLSHYTGVDWKSLQPWILLTNYNRYVDQFVKWGLEEIFKEQGPYVCLTLPGGGVIHRGDSRDAAEALISSAAWQRYQMPGYSLGRNDNKGGITIINIGVGPSNAKNITDHLAVLRPNCWLMVGHCGGLRSSQTIGDYVLAHAYLRRDGILDDVVPPYVPIPALAEVQVALQKAAAQVTGEHGDSLKRRLRTGTVVTYDDRNWELRWSKERRLINQGRAIAVDMESGTLATQGYRLRVPYGTLLCVSDKPLHGEIKLPGAATAFYQKATTEHLAIGLAAFDILREDLSGLHSRKLRSFDEPPFR